MWNWIIQNKELIEMVANIAVAIAVVFSAVALIINACAFRLNRKEFRNDLFHKISQQISSIMDEQTDCEAKGKRAIENWLERVFNSLEYFAYFANRGSFTPEMENYYKPTLISCCDYIQSKEFSGLLKRFQSGSKIELCEIRKLYRQLMDKECPF